MLGVLRKETRTATMARKDVKKAKQGAVPEKASAVAAAVTGQTLTLVEELKKSMSSAYTQYLKDLERDQKLRLVDTFLAFLVVVGVFQFSFCLLGGSYPFNAFLSGFSATVGQFVLTVALRLQSSAENKELFGGLLPERAFGEYVLASLVLHFVLIHFIN